MSLIAKRDVLFRSKMYKPGDVLPADNEAMVEAWLAADSAKWDDEDAQEAVAEVAPEAGTPEEGAPEAGTPEEEPKPKKEKAKKGKK